MAGEIELPKLIQRILVEDSDLNRAERRAAAFEGNVTQRMTSAAQSTDKVTEAEQSLAAETDRGTRAMEGRRTALQRLTPLTNDRVASILSEMRANREATLAEFKASQERLRAGQDMARQEFIAAKQRAQKLADTRAQNRALDEQMRSMTALERAAGGTADQLARMDSLARAKATQGDKTSSLLSDITGIGNGRDRRSLLAGAAGGGGKGILATLKGASDGGSSLSSAGMTALGALKLPAILAGLGAATSLMSSLVAGTVSFGAALAPAAGLIAAMPAQLIAVKSAMPIFKYLTADANNLSKIFDTQAAARSAFMSTKPNAKQLAAFNKSQSQALTAAEQKSNLTPSGIAYAKGLYDFQQGPLQNIKTQGQAGLFPQLSKVFKDLAPAMPVVAKGMREIGGAIGGVADRFAKMVSSAPWLSKIGQLMHQDAGIVTNFGAVLMKMADALTTVMVSAMPLVKWMENRELNLATRIDSWVASASKTGKLTKFFQSTEHVVSLLSHSTGQLFAGLGHVFGIASKVNALQGGGPLQTFDRMMTSFNQWTSSAHGGLVIFKWLQDSKPVLHELGQVIGSLLSLVVKFSTGTGTLGFLKLVNDKLIPALGDFVSSTGKWAPELLGAAVDLASAFAKIEGAIAFQPIVDMATAIAKLAASIGDLIAATPGLGTALGYIAAGGVALKIAKGGASAIGIGGLFAKGGPLRGGGRGAAGAAAETAAAAPFGGINVGGIGAATPVTGFMGAFRAGREGWAPRPSSPGTTGGRFGPLGFFGPLGPVPFVGRAADRLSSGSAAVRSGLGGARDTLGRTAGRVTAQFSRPGMGALGLGVAVGGGLLGSLASDKSGASDTSGRNLFATALKGGSAGAGLGMMLGPEGAAAGAVVGAVGAIALAFLHGRSAAQKHADTVKAALKEDQKAAEDLGGALADAMQFDGFKKGAGYADTLFQALSKTPGAMESMAKFGLTIKDVQGYMDGNRDSADRVTAALAGTGKQGDDLRRTLNIMTDAQRRAVASDDARAQVLGKVTDHMKVVATKTDALRTAVTTLNAAKANPHVDINSQDFKTKMDAVELRLKDLKRENVSIPIGIDLKTFTDQKKGAAVDAFNKMVHDQNDPHVVPGGTTMKNDIQAYKDAIKAYTDLGGSIGDLPALPKMLDATPPGNGHGGGFRGIVPMTPGQTAPRKAKEINDAFSGDAKKKAEDLRAAIERLNAVQKDIHIPVDDQRVTDARANVKRLQAELDALGGKPGGTKPLPKIEPPRQLTTVTDLAAHQLSLWKQHNANAATAKADAAKRAAATAAAAKAAVAKRRQDAADAQVFAHGTDAEKQALRLKRLSPAARKQLDQTTAEVTQAFATLAPLGAQAWQSLNRALTPDRPLGVGLIQKGENLRVALARILQQIQKYATDPIPVPKVGVNITSLDVAPHVGTRVGARALGGNMKAFMPYWVGEQGPEKVYPTRDATVVPHNQSMAEAGGGSHSYSTAFNFYGDIHATDMKATMLQASRLAQNAALSGLAPEHAMAMQGVPS